MRQVGRVVLVVTSLILLVACAAAVWLVLSTRGPARSGDRILPGLAGEVVVEVDDLGVPHIRAGSEDDLFRAQGYLHARDRLWQMELFRRVAEGRLSEILGEAALGSDRFLRTLGLGRAATDALDTLPPDTRRAVDAYVAGVNAAIEGWRGPFPPEFVLLRTRPAPWTAAQTLAMEKIMAWDLADHSETLALARARHLLPDETWERIRPQYPADGLTILEDHMGPDGENPTGGEGEPSGSTLPRVPLDLLASAQPPRLAARLLDAAGAVRASNSWVVGGERTRSGKPLLANDMHLSLGVPTLWYLVVLDAPGLRVAGMSLPGSPGVVAGRTPGVAWGFTNAVVDDADLFIERVDPADSTRYLVPGGSEPFRIRIEEITVRGRPDPVLLQVRETRHGPIITGVEATPGEDLLALAWVGHAPAGTAGAILGMNRAETTETFLNALEGFGNPHQNVVFADTSGDFGYRMAGRVPIRGDRRPPPQVPVPGWTGDHDWRGFLPLDEHPAERNPERGFVVTANHRQTAQPVSRLITAGSWAEPFRALSIRNGILGADVHDLHSMRALQTDVVDLGALRHVGAAVEAFHAVGASPLAQLLAAWDGTSGVERVEPVIFHTWRENLRSRVRSRVYPEGTSGLFSTGALDRVVLDGGAEAFGAEAHAAARETAGLWPGGVAEIPAWGEVHQLLLEHPLAGIPVMSSLLGFQQVRHPVPGGPGTVNVAGFSGSSPPFTVTHGASQRHVSDLADPWGTGWFILPGGQSGFPRSPHAWDQLPLWMEGRLHPLATLPGRQAPARDLLRLLPR